ncbi:hypothetical protein ACFQAT_27520 [Undibacterium arcticum]|uniref:PNPLA domain-containing protein n=1 Tax=Undibacterium arcticum TaxID=1762892 RepID=A0ABV7FA84_9BURK
MDNRQTVLVLHGGRALDANQAGIYEELSAQNTHIDWVVGTPIGAINGAIIAGNPPQHRVRKLHEFCDLVGQTAPFLFSFAMFGAFFRRLENSGRTMETVINGIPGFPCSPQRRLPPHRDAAKPSCGCVIRIAVTSARSRTAGCERRSLLSIG